MKKAIYFFLGVAFGFVLIRSGVSSYDVIRDMFLFRSFHLYGVLLIAVSMAFGFNWVLKKKRTTSLTGDPIDWSVHTLNRGHVIGGLLGGAGWAITGACPGPALALIGNGVLSGIFIAAGVFVGTYLFGQFSD